MSKIHSREKIVHDANLKLLNVLVDIQKELTTGEYLRVLAEQFGNGVGSIAKYMIREERHPGKPDMPGGLE